MPHIHTVIACRGEPVSNIGPPFHWHELSNCLLWRALHSKVCALLSVCVCCRASLCGSETDRMRPRCTSCSRDDRSHTAPERCGAGTPSTHVFLLVCVGTRGGVYTSPRPPVIADNLMSLYSSIPEKISCSYFIPLYLSRQFSTFPCTLSLL